MSDFDDLPDVSDDFGDLPDVAGVTPAAKRSWLENYGRVMGLGARASQEGGVGGILGAGAMVADSVVGAGRDLVAGADYGLSALGLTKSPYDSERYYPKGGEPTASLAGALGFGGDDRPPAMPTSIKAGQAAKAIPDALGLPVPETATERTLVGAGSGIVSAMTPLGINRVMAAGQSTPSVLRSLGTAGAANPVVQTVGGGLGGAGAAAGAEMDPDGPGAMIGGIGGNLLPILAGRRAGTVYSGTERGQEAIAGEILRHYAGDDVGPTIARLEASRANTPGFQHFGSNASQNYGIAAVSDRFSDFAKNLSPEVAPAKLEARNSAALSRALDSQGAREGVAEATRQRAFTRAESDRANMGLDQLPDIPADNLLMDLADAQRLRGTGRSVDDVAAAGDISKRLQASSKPRYMTYPSGPNAGQVVNDLDGNPIIEGYDINPRDLSRVRSDLSQARYPKNGNPSAALPNVAAAKATTRRHITDIDAELDNATGGAWQSHLEDTADIRSTADSQDYIASLARRSEIGTLPTGERELNFGRLYRDTRPGSFMDQLPIQGVTNPRPVARERIDPARRSFLQGVNEDLRVNNFRNSRGVRGRGSSTAFNADVNGLIGDAVESSRSPGQKMAGGIAQALNIGSAPAGRVTTMLGGLGAGAAAQFLTRSAAGRMLDSVTGNAERTGAGVARNLGRAETSPGEMARLMRIDPLYRGSAGDTLKRGMVRGGLLGANGYISGQREQSRYR